MHLKAFACIGRAHFYLWVNAGFNLHYVFHCVYRMPDCLAYLNVEIHSMSCHIWTKYYVDIQSGCPICISRMRGISEKTRIQCDTLLLPTTRIKLCVMTRRLCSYRLHVSNYMVVDMCSDTNTM